VEKISFIHINFCGLPIQAKIWRHPAMVSQLIADGRGTKLKLRSLESNILCKNFH